jgi:adenosine kinase
MALFVNDYEYALVHKATGLTAADFLAQTREGQRSFVIVTRGEQGAHIYTQGGIYNIPVVAPLQIADPTGVGDAFRGGFLMGYSLDLDWETCGRMGALAATFCLEQRGPQGHSFTPEEFVARYRKYFNDHSKLDQLIDRFEKTKRMQGS